MSDTFDHFMDAVESELDHWYGTGAGPDGPNPYKTDSGKLKTVEDIKLFVLGGNAIFTIENIHTGNRFTFKIKRAKDVENLHFVSVLNGPDNVCSYSYIGTIFDKNRFRWTKKSKVTSDADSVVAFGWFWRMLIEDKLRKFPQLEVWHEGVCGRCGRTLTVPESLETGLGPSCRKLVQKELEAK